MSYCKSQFYQNFGSIFTTFTTYIWRPLSKNFIKRFQSVISKLEDFWCNFMTHPNVSTYGILVFGFCFFDPIISGSCLLIISPIVELLESNHVMQLICLFRNKPTIHNFVQIFYISGVWILVLVRSFNKQHLHLQNQFKIIVDANSTIMAVISNFICDLTCCQYTLKPLHFTPLKIRFCWTYQKRF